MQLRKGICAKWPAERVVHPHRVISASAGNSETVAAPQRWEAQCGVKRRSHHMDICCQVLALSSAHSAHPLSCCYKFLSFNWMKGVWKVLCSIQFITRIIHSNVPVNSYPTWLAMCQLLPTETRTKHGLCFRRACEWCSPRQWTVPTLQWHCRGCCCHSQVYRVNTFWTPRSGTSFGEPEVSCWDRNHLYHGNLQMPQTRAISPWETGC